MADPISLIEKYNTQGPRYTSYPTVPYWDTNPTAEQWIASVKNALDQAERDDCGAALYVHIPFCSSLCTFCGCTTHITKKREYAQPYIETVLKELDLYIAALGGRKIHLSEIHLGGGTPTWLSTEELDKLLSGILARVSLKPDIEMSLEVDPRVTHEEHLRLLHSKGFHRISLGIQDFDHKVQSTINRVQSYEQVADLTHKARALGYKSINYDLVYGLPYQTIESIERTMAHICELKPDRIAYYSYAHVPWIKPGQRSYTDKDLPSGQQKLALYERGLELLQQAGYEAIGMDHFALKTDSLFKAKGDKTLYRNFMGYMPRKVHPMIGLGMSSISDTGSAFIQNIKTVKEYQDKIHAGELALYRGHALSSEDQILRQHILNLMTQYHTAWDIEETYTPFLDTVHQTLQEAVKDKLIDVTNKSVTINEKGRPFLRNIAMAFDARLFHKTPGQKIFSETI